MSFQGREIDENGYVIFEPLIPMNNDKKTDIAKYNRVYHREYYRKFLSVKVSCEYCGRNITKEKLKIHQKSNKCQRLREVQSKQE